MDVVNQHVSEYYINVTDENSHVMMTALKHRCLNNLCALYTLPCALSVYIHTQYRIIIITKGVTAAQRAKEFAKGAYHRLCSSDVCSICLEELSLKLTCSIIK